MTEAIPRFRCYSVTHRDLGLGGETCDVVLRPVYGGNGPGNECFFATTPSGEINLQVVWRAAARQFVPGREYDVLFRPVGDEP